MTDGLKERILRSVTLERVVGAYLTLTRRGSALVGLCPFHDDRHPSLSVHVGKQLYKCFACDAGGDLFSFVMRMENCSFPEALRILAHRYGILPGEEAVRNPMKDLPIPKKVPVINSQFSIIEREHARFLSMLSPFRPAMDVLGDTYRRFEVGVAPVQVPFAYDKLGGRLVFPLRNETGKLCGFAGRWIGVGERPADVPKYYNSPTSGLYVKSRFLYALREAADGIRSHGFVYITEGYKDALAMHAAGFSNTVAICGVAFTEEYAGLLAPYTRRLVFLLDADPAGEDSMARLSALWDGRERMEVSRAQLPYGEDPDSLLAHRGLGGMREVIRRCTRVARLETYERLLRSESLLILEQLRLALTVEERMPLLRTLSTLKKRESRVSLILRRNVFC